MKDDHIVKPFSVPELLARVKGLLGLASPERLADVAHLWRAPTRPRETPRSPLRPADRLGPTECRLLRYFLEHPGGVFSREQLLDAVWGREVYTDERSVDVPIGRLRKMLNAGRDTIRSEPMRGVGYSLDDRFAKPTE